MLKRIQVTLESELEIAFGPRLNLLTGENGVGKSLLLEVAWWALTNTWNRPVHPHGDFGCIQYSYTNTTPKGAKSLFTSSDPYLSKYGAWLVAPHRHHARAMSRNIVLYARDDGGFCVWDGLQNHASSQPDPHDKEVPPAFFFTADQIWSGCEHTPGVLKDYFTWQSNKDVSGESLIHLFKGFNPSLPKNWSPLKASPSERRLLSLAYLLVWVWRGNEVSAARLGRKPNRDITLLFDAVDASLSPAMQRRVVPALLKWTQDLKKNLQLIANTHSPLVLASLEPLFDPQMDKLHLLQTSESQPRLVEQVFVPRGEVGNWLVSDSFGLQEPRSFEGEQAIVFAKHFSGPDFMNNALVEKAEEMLRAAGLPDLDPFWVRWRHYKDRFFLPGSQI